MNAFLSPEKLGVGPSRTAAARPRSAFRELKHRANTASPMSVTSRTVSTGLNPVFVLQNLPAFQGPER